MSLDALANSLDGYVVVLGMMSAIMMGFLGYSIKVNGFRFLKGKGGSD